MPRVYDAFEHHDCDRAARARAALASAIMGGLREGTGMPLQVGEDAVASFLAQTVELIAKNS